MARITAAYRVEEVFGKGRGGRPCVRLLHPVEYRVRAEDSPETITVPAGFETDFASVPVGLWNLFPPHGPWARPAIVHDFLYETTGTGLWRPDGAAGDQRFITRPTDYSRAEADAIFREAMAVVGVSAWRREVMFLSVRLGGASGWRRRAALGG